jgi:hypothetical protein
MSDTDQEESVQFPVEVTQSAVRYTIAELAKRNGQIRSAREDLGDLPYTPEHLAASVLNAWARHDYFIGGEVALTDAEYLKCINAAKIGSAVPELDLHSKTPALDPAPDRSAIWSK